MGGIRNINLKCKLGQGPEALTEANVKKCTSELEKKRDKTIELTKDLCSTFARTWNFFFINDARFRLPNLTINECKAARLVSEVNCTEPKLVHISARQFVNPHYELQLSCSTVFTPYIMAPARNHDGRILINGKRLGTGTLKY